MADRYTYLPLIGVFIMLSWCGAEAAPRIGKRRNAVMATVSSVVILLLLALSFQQIAVWRETVTLFHHASEVSPENWMVRRMLGNALADKGLADEAIEQYRDSIRIQPRNALAHNNLAVELARQGKRQEAIEHYREAIRIRPEFVEAFNNLGNALAVLGRREEAIEQYRRAMELRPNWAVPRDNLRRLLDSEQAAVRR
jgi:Flp pilus assembly protein TadD